MRPDVRAYLWDIQAAAEAIERFVDGLDAEAYAAAELVNSAVERKFAIIGEALAQLAKRDPAMLDRIPDARAIIAFRNLLIHGYAVVDHHRVWGAARTALPGLRGVVTALLDALPPP